MAVAAMTPAVDPESLPDSQGPLLLLHEVNNPNNLGAVLRTADWFGFRTVLISAGSCETTNPKVVRTSMGSLFHLTLIEEVDFEKLLPRLRGRVRVVGSDVREGVATASLRSRDGAPHGEREPRPARVASGPD